MAPRIIRQERIQQLTELAAQGKTHREIAREMGISLHSIYHLAKVEEVSLPDSRGMKKKVIPDSTTFRRSSKERIAIIKRTLQQGERSLEMLVRGAQCGLNSFHKLCVRHGISLPKDIIPYRYRPGLDIMIDEGLNINEIAVRYTHDTGKSLTRQAVEQYLAKSRQKPYWKRKKEERRERELLPERKEQQKRLLILQSLELQMTQRAQQEGWAYGKAVEWMHARKRPTMPARFKKVLRLFRLYEQAQQQGKKRSLEELAEKSGIAQQLLSTYFHLTNVPAMCQRWTRPSSAIVAEKKRRVFSIAEAGLPLTASDLEYFSGISKDSIRTYFHQAGISSAARAIGIKRFGSPQTAFHFLNYRTASKIYEAKDAGFDKAEVQEYADNVAPNMIQYALKRRREIALVITKALQLLFPEENIKKPYRESIKYLDDVLLQEYDPVYLAYQHLPWKPVEVAYFVKMRGGSVSQHYRAWARGDVGKKTEHRDRAGSQIVTLRTASQIYQLQDAGVPEKAIAERLKRDPAFVRMALEKRTEYEPEIVRGLQIMFPQEKIRTPYR